MKRKTFLLYSAFGAAAIGLSSIQCRSKDSATNKTLGQPLLLSHFCDKKTIRDMGIFYRKRMDAESSEGQLVHLLLRDATGKSIPESTDSAHLQTLLAQKIKEDFQAGNALTLKGWVVSVTEARQCALFSLIYRNGN